MQLFFNEITYLEGIVTSSYSTNHENRDFALDLAKKGEIIKLRLHHKESNGHLIELYEALKEANKNGKDKLKAYYM